MKAWARKTIGIIKAMAIIGEMTIAIGILNMEILIMNVETMDK
jgi:hypothetical protein